MRSGWMHVAGFEGQEKFAPKTLAEQVYVDENKNILELLNENSNVDDEAIRKIVASSVVFSSEILGESVWDNDNLFSTKIMQSDGNIFWIDDSAEVYSITRSEGSIELRSNQNLQGKKLNIISIKNSDMLVFVGLVQKQKNITINTNAANQSKLIDKALQDGTVVYKADRVECRPQSTSRKMIATKAIDVTNYSRARMYGKLYWEFGQAQYAAHFGILKKEALDNTAGTDPNKAFVVMKRLTGLNENNYLEIDISQASGMQYIGAYGIASWDTFKFELLR